MSDYIKLYRAMFEWEWYRSINTKVLFIHMLLKANWKEGKFEGKIIPRGSFVSSIKKLSEETELTNDEVRTALNKLLKTKEITKQSTNKFTVFTVVNYELYQGSSQAEPNQNPSNSQTIPKLFPTIEEKKEGKKERRKEEKKEDTNVSKKKEPAVYYPNDEKLNQAFADFVDMRKQIKKPMTDRAVTLAMNKLKELSNVPFSDSMDNETAIKILEQSTMNCWQGLFPLKESNSNKKNQESDWVQKWRDA